jgi:NitT/TauT family transport system substrate-binding protein
MKVSKKYFKVLSLVTLFALVITACSTKPATTANSAAANATTAKSTTVANVVKSNQAKAPIKILYSAGLCGIPIHIAKQLQFLEAEGLVEGVDYQYVTSSTSGVEMLSTKQADISFGMLSAMLAPLDNGLEAKTVLGVHTGCVQVLGSTSSGVKSIKDLKGKNIGVQQLASSTHVVIQRALADAGIGSTPDNMQVEFIVFDKDTLPLVLKSGEVDAIGIGDPQATILVNEGAGVSIFNSATSDLLKDEYCCTLWARNEILKNQPEQVAKITRAVQNASTWVAQNIDLAAQIQLDNAWLVGDYDIDRKTLATFKYLTSVSGVKEGLTRNIVDMKTLGLIKKDTDTEQLAKTSFFKLDGVPDEVTKVIVPPIDPKTQTKAK